MSRSSSRLWPLSGCRCALIRLTSVVLPAPFDPTSDKNSPLLTTKSRPSQARVSPNCFRKFTVLSRITSGLPSCQPLTEVRNGTDDAGRQYQHQGDQDDAEQKLPILGRRDRVGFQVGEHQSADDRPGEIAETAEQRGEHDLAGERPVEHVGRGQAVERHPQDAGKAGEGSGDQKGDPAEPADPDAEKARTDLVVADGLQRLAEWRVHDHPHHDYAHDEDGQHVIIIRRDELLESARAGEAEQAQQQARTGNPQAVAAAGFPIELERQAVEHLGKRQREDAEENLRVAHANIAQQRRRDCDHRNPDQDVELHGMRAEVLDHEGNGVGADAEIGGMAEREQAGVAEQQVESERGDRRDQAVDQKLHLIGVDEARQQEQQQQDRRRRGGELEHGAIARSFEIGLHHAVPNRPVGLTSSTRAAMRYSTASSSSGKNWIPAVRTKLTTRAPTSAPFRLPSPPITTTTKAMTKASTPMPRTAAWVGTTIAPPRPAMKQPIVKAST